MLNLTDSIISTLFGCLMVDRVRQYQSKKSKDIELKIKHHRYMKMPSLEVLKIVFLRAATDAFVVSGLTFFGTIAAQSLDLKVAFASGLIAGGLSFFTELKKWLNKI